MPPFSPPSAETLALSLPSRAFTVWCLKNDDELSFAASARFAPFAGSLKNFDAPPFELDSHPSLTLFVSPPPSLHQFPFIPFFFLLKLFVLGSTVIVPQLWGGAINLSSMVFSPFPQISSLVLSSRCLFVFQESSPKSSLIVPKRTFFSLLRWALKLSPPFPDIVDHSG